MLNPLANIPLTAKKFSPYTLRIRTIAKEVRLIMPMANHYIKTPLDDHPFTLACPKSKITN
jgi:hypothetical protein